jgi:hypothetical protein
MNIRLHIDRVVLDGIGLAAADRPHLRAAMESEIARLIGERGLSPELAGGIAVPSVRAPGIELGADARPAQIGTAIAGAVMGGVGGKQ